MDFRLQQSNKYEVSRNWRKSILDALVAHNVRSIARVASAAPAASFLSSIRTQYKGRPFILRIAGDTYLSSIGSGCVDTEKCGHFICELHRTYHVLTTCNIFHLA